MKLPLSIRLKISDAQLHPERYLAGVSICAGLLVGTLLFNAFGQTEIKSKCYIEIGSQRVPVSCPER